MRQVGLFLSAIMWLLVAGSVVVLTGGLMGRPLLLAAVPTGSMAPVLEPGDMIVVLPTWVMPGVAKGDIVVFKNPGESRWVVHRIVAGSVADGFITKGDANPTEDKPVVEPGQIAGVVPNWPGGALRLPRLGVLSLAEGPFTSPVVAGIALVLGIYLLAMDVRKRAPGSRVRSADRGKMRPDQVLHLYLGLSAMAFLSTLVTAWSLGSTQTIRWEVVESRASNIKIDSQYLVGQPHTDLVKIPNPSPLPLVVTIHSQDARIAFDRTWALIPPKGSHQFALTVQNPAIGSFETRVETGVFLPVLPPQLLDLLALGGRHLAAFVSALVAPALLLGLTVADARCRTAVSRIRSRVAARFGI